MTDIAVDAPDATTALDRGRGEAEDVADTAQAQEPQSNDPKVAELLRALSGRTSDDAERAGEHTTGGASAAQGLTAADEESGSAIAGPASGGGATASSSRSSTATLSPAQVAASQQQMAAQQQTGQLASQQAQQQQMMAAAQQQQLMAAAQQQQMASAVQQAAMAMSSVAAPAATAGLPDGTILVDPNDLASLIDPASVGGSGFGSSTGAPWNGSTSPEPVDISQVQYEKTHGKLSQEEMSAVVDSAMDKTGIENPEARAKWKNVLLYMAVEESGNDASAVNNSDSNAVGPTQVDGSPAQASRGPWQTIPGTFAANHAAGTSTNIYDPEASAGAAINYMKDRYAIGHDGSGLDEFYAARAHGKYVGY
ncbi:MAG: transglycosylase SLT domain-containing protein [Rhodococcus sp. (in: high G+C Gram-positive bacteria)]|uniref:transglycosylase SLT domain-containing protein n=1 Tax=Rhodococcus sp. TaxID=1831 RepID=UPI003BAF2225